MILQLQMNLESVFSEPPRGRTRPRTRFASKKPEGFWQGLSVKKRIFQDTDFIGCFCGVDCSTYFKLACIWMYTLPKTKIAPEK